MLGSPPPTLSCSERMTALIMMPLMSCNSCDAGNSPSGSCSTRLTSISRQRSHRLRLICQRVNAASIFKLRKAEIVALKIATVESNLELISYVIQ